MVCSRVEYKVSVVGIIVSDRRFSPRWNRLIHVSLTLICLLELETIYTAMSVFTQHLLAHLLSVFAVNDSEDARSFILEGVLRA